jgi:hypothetical protein
VNFGGLKVDAHAAVLSDCDGVIINLVAGEIVGRFQLDRSVVALHLLQFYVVSTRFQYGDDDAKTPAWLELDIAVGSDYGRGLDWFMGGTTKRKCREHDSTDQIPDFHAASPGALNTP